MLNKNKLNKIKIRKNHLPYDYNHHSSQCTHDISGTVGREEKFSTFVLFFLFQEKKKKEDW